MCEKRNCAHADVVISIWNNTQCRRLNLHNDSFQNIIQKCILLVLSHTNNVRKSYLPNNYSNSEYMLFHEGLLPCWNCTKMHWKDGFPTFHYKNRTLGKHTDISGLWVHWLTGNNKRNDLKLVETMTSAEMEVGRQEL